MKTQSEEVIVMRPKGGLRFSYRAFQSVLGAVTLLVTSIAMLIFSRIPGTNMPLPMIYIFVCLIPLAVILLLLIVNAITITVTIDKNSLKISGRIFKERIIPFSKIVSAIMFDDAPHMTGLLVRPMSLHIQTAEKKHKLINFVLSTEQLNTIQSIIMQRVPRVETIWRKLQWVTRLYNFMIYLMIFMIFLGIVYIGIEAAKGHYPEVVDTSGNKITSWSQFWNAPENHK